jgi:hypothetical protein
MPDLPLLAKSVPKEPVALTISMYNDAGIPWETLRAAEEEASYIFHEAGIEIRWRNCLGEPEGAEEAEGSRNCSEALFPNHLHVRLVKRSVGLSPDAMGVSFLSEDGSGCQADLFFEEMERLREKGKARLPNILGHVAAHEIGHLLLGTNSHAPQGIMRAVWGLDELMSASQGALLFSEQQADKMRRRLKTTVALGTEALRSSKGQLRN